MIPLGLNSLYNARINYFSNLFANYIQIYFLHIYTNCIHLFEKLIHMLKVFLFYCVDGIEDLGHGVEHAALGQRLGQHALWLGYQGLTTDWAEPEVDEDVGEAEEAQDEDQGLEQVVGIKRVDNAAIRNLYESIFLMMNWGRKEIVYFLCFK